jgi:hypothetical protein
MSKYLVNKAITEIESKRKDLPPSLLPDPSRVIVIHSGDVSHVDGFDEWVKIALWKYVKPSPAELKGIKDVVQLNTFIRASVKQLIQFCGSNGVIRYKVNAQVIGTWLYPKLKLDDTVADSTAFDGYRFAVAQGDIPSNPHHNPYRLYKPSEVADLFGVTEPTIRKLMNEGLLKSGDYPGLKGKRITADQLKEYIDNPTQTQ